MDDPLSGNAPREHERIRPPLILYRFDISYIRDEIDPNVLESFETVQSEFNLGR